MKAPRKPNDEDQDALTHAIQLARPLGPLDGSMIPTELFADDNDQPTGRHPSPLHIRTDLGRLQSAVQVTAETAKRQGWRIEHVLQALGALQARLVNYDRALVCVLIVGWTMGTLLLVLALVVATQLWYGP